MVFMPNQVFFLNDRVIPGDRENKEIEIFFRPEHAAAGIATGSYNMKDQPC